MGMGDQPHASAALPLDKKAGAHCTGGWVPSLSVWKCVGKMKFLATTEVRTPNPPRIASPYTDYVIPAPEVTRMSVSLLFIIKNQKEKFCQWKCFSLLFFFFL